MMTHAEWKNQAEWVSASRSTEVKGARKSGRKTAEDECLKRDQAEIDSFHDWAYKQELWKGQMCGTGNQPIRASIEKNDDKPHPVFAEVVLHKCCQVLRHQSHVLISAHYQTLNALKIENTLKHKYLCF